MLLELARPVALLMCIFSLCGLFHTAFLVSTNDFEQTVYDSLEMLVLTTGISVASGFVFREAMARPKARAVSLRSTFPVQMFVWAAGIMFILFIISWYLRAHYVFYRDIRIWV